VSVCVRHTLVFEVGAFETLEGAGVCVRVCACVKFCAIQMVQLSSCRLQLQLLVAMVAVISQFLFY